MSNIKFGKASSKMKTRYIVRVAILSALSAVLYALPGIPVIPPIYKLDFSGIPVLIGGLLLGPVAGVIIALIKDLTGLMHSSSAGVGELADFICSVAMVIPTALIYRNTNKTSMKAIAFLLGVIVMAIAGAAANYWILIPFYVSPQMPLDSIVNMIAKTIPSVDSLGKLIFYATIPFNLLKGAVVAIVVWILNLRLSKYLRM
ncbi:MAG: ECF transporter S component [Clostridia bacterium]|nr:ECF transporter S component [Clostridia bacterium]